MKRVLVAEAISERAVELLREKLDVAYLPNIWKSAEELACELRVANALIVRNQTQVAAHVIREAKALTIIGRAGAGLDNIDVAAATEAGIVVSSTPHHNAVSVAELTIGLILALARKIPAADRDTKAGGWNRKKYTGIELHGKTIGIVGFGRIGFLTAMRAGALGMRVIAYDPYVDRDSILISQAQAELKSVEDVLAESDVVCCHLPSTPATIGMFNAERFAAMRRGALFLNVARGEVVDEGALVEALKSGHLAGAALDVRQIEPPAADPFCEMEQVILTPHIGAFTAEAQERVEWAVCRDVISVLAGESAINAVNISKPCKEVG